MPAIDRIAELLTEYPWPTLLWAVVLYLAFRLVGCLVLLIESEIKSRPRYRGLYGWRSSAAPAVPSRVDDADGSQEMDGSSNYNPDGASSDHSRGRIQDLSRPAIGEADGSQEMDSSSSPGCVNPHGASNEHSGGCSPDLPRPATDPQQSPGRQG